MNSIELGDIANLHDPSFRKSSIVPNLYTPVEKDRGVFDEFLTNAEKMGYGKIVVEVSTHGMLTFRHKATDFIIYQASPNYYGAKAKVYDPNFEQQAIKNAFAELQTQTPAKFLESATRRRKAMQTVADAYKIGRLASQIALHAELLPQAVLLPVLRSMEAIYSQVIEIVSAKQNL